MLFFYFSLDDPACNLPEFRRPRSADNEVNSFDRLSAVTCYFHYRTSSVQKRFEQRSAPQFALRFLSTARSCEHAQSFEWLDRFYDRFYNFSLVPILFNRRRSVRPSARPFVPLSSPEPPRITLQPLPRRANLSRASRPVA